ncbi:MAG: hypothetical protein HC871_08700 [Rhizobiales bacterium]|nr:hypothetical protein [Hyphomicrobiales bacterium]
MMKPLVRPFLRGMGLALKVIGGPSRGSDNSIDHLRLGTVIDSGVAR